MGVIWLYRVLVKVVCLGMLHFQDLGNFVEEYIALVVALVYFHDYSETSYFFI